MVAGSGTVDSSELLEYYEFTGDVSYICKITSINDEGRGNFYDNILIDDGTGHLVSSQVIHPEHGPRTWENTYEQTLIWQLYEDTIKAAGNSWC